MALLIRGDSPRVRWWAVGVFPRRGQGGARARECGCGNLPPAVLHLEAGTTLSHLVGSTHWYWSKMLLALSACRLGLPSALLNAPPMNPRANGCAAGCLYCTAGRSRKCPRATFVALSGWIASRDARRSAVEKRLVVPCEVITTRQRAAVVGILDAVSSTLLMTPNTRNPEKSPLCAPSPASAVQVSLLFVLGATRGSDAPRGRADEPCTSDA